MKTHSSRNGVFKIFNCCTSRQDLTSTYPDDCKESSLYSTRRIPAPVRKSQDNKEVQEKQLGNERSRLRRTKSSASRTSLRRNTSAKDNPDAPSNPPKYTPLELLKVDSHTHHRDNVFRPLKLDLSKPDDEWSPTVPHTGQSPPRKPSRYSKELPDPNAPRIPLHTKPTSSNQAGQYETHPNSSPDDHSALIVTRKENPGSRSHHRTRSEPAPHERVDISLAEKMNLLEQLKNVESDIEKRNRFLYSRPSSRSNSRPSSQRDSRSFSRPTSRASKKNSLNFNPYEPLPPYPVQVVGQFSSLPTFHAHQNSTVSEPYHDQPPPVSIRNRSFSMSSSRSHTIYRPDQGIPLPPLPLVLQAPSFDKTRPLSRVSSWLTTSSQHEISRSSNSVTNTPRPITGRDGFYQCVEQYSISTDTSTTVTNSYLSQPTTCTSQILCPDMRKDVDPNLARALRHPGENSKVIKEIEDAEHNEVVLPDEQWAHIIGLAF
ncbi:BgTH12-04022 [Blumeria graminis f. sp. triticale]|uniref:BgTH12-04022 n=1 Tax=Blumeria graminis f. sp. triticale TaxID=1689686 RepID=A0A9W4CWZ1_BLUGR|nr:BgTH12-04022 [Blumeria graminis f. sp. triticale]